MKDLTPVSSAMRETLSLAAPAEWGETVARVCTTCKNFLVKQKIPLFSVTNGYRYPPMPPGLPVLNDVAERLLSPRIPFVSDPSSSCYYN
uniref:Uncharacterized protein n=1 Tax=Ixodes ricinus TaxID=34613 RepID=A0A0K8R5T5_IXORI